MLELCLHYVIHFAIGDVHFQYHLSCGINKAFLCVQQGKDKQFLFDLWFLVVFYFVFESIGVIRYFFFLTKRGLLVIVGDIDRPSDKFSGIRIFVFEMCFQIYA